MTDCTQNRSKHTLLHEGTSQEQRFARSLDPAFAPIDEHGIAHRTVFAQAYSAFLKYYDTNNAPIGDWKSFFSDDVSVLLAMAAVQDVDFYRQKTREYFIFLNSRANENNKKKLRDYLDYLFSCCATLAVRLDRLHNKLPDEIVLKGTLRNCIQSQLAPVLKRLITYHKGGEAITDQLKVAFPENEFSDQNPLNESADEKAASLAILGDPAVKFSALGEADLSKFWTDGTDWQPYYLAIAADTSVYGSEPPTFARINHLATHNLFTAIFDQFLKVYARIVKEAGQTLEESLTKWDCHEPHYALFLAFLRLFEHARTELNSLTGRHLDFYYRNILRLKEKEAEPGKAHLLLELAKQISEHEVKAGELFKAGKDDLGKDVFFANDSTLVANRAEVVALKTVYRHGGKGRTQDRGRIYASLVANSADGLGAELTSEDQSWHPFFNKIYKEGKLSQVNMPKAELGFAVASHYLLMAGGERTITLRFVRRPIASFGTFSVPPSEVVFSRNYREVGSSNTLKKEKVSSLLVSRPRKLTPPDYKDEIVCSLTGEEGWIEAKISKFDITTGELRIELSGADPAVVPYSPKTHGYNFQTDLPVLLMKLLHNDNVYIYSVFKDFIVSKIDLEVKVENLKTLAVSNDFGPVDTSKPFWPFGASPVKNSALIIGSKEAFQKSLSTATINITWQNPPTPYDDRKVKIITEYLQAGNWENGNKEKNITDEGVPFSVELPSENFFAGEPDFSELEFYNINSKHGFVRLKINNDFGQESYLTALRNDLIDKNKVVSSKDLDDEPPHPSTTPILSEASMSLIDTSKVILPGDLGKKLGPPPTLPVASEITLNYTTEKQSINLEQGATFPTRPARFFHLTLFGQAEQHPFLKSKLNIDSKIYLLPQFFFNQDNANGKSDAGEFYIGINGLKPPQNLALLFQVADGTADPDLEKPDPHIHWSYLSGNEWLPFEKNQVEDHTGGLLNSGIITFSVPRDATDTNSLLPSGMHWLRAAVSSASDAVCRLRMVAAQAVEATFTDRDNDPAFPTKALPLGTINKLARPHAAVKKVKQPFETFGGRGKEASRAFYTRISERLRHKDRAVTLWDYERLVLEAFPQIYKVKCLNHTQFEPSKTGRGIYRESAPGHVTLITIPDQQYHTQRNPLRPRTSLGLLEEIMAFLLKRSSCFIDSERLHVRNPLFEEVEVKCSVRFYDGFDEKFYKNKLQEAVTRFLSPWAFPNCGSPSFGGKIYKSVLINFVEEQPYVDYVTDFKLFHTFIDIDGNQRTVEKNEAEGSKAVSILVSAASHTIAPIQSVKAARPGEKCPCLT